MTTHKAGEDARESDSQEDALAVLTPREVQVLRLVANGMSAKEVGRLLEIAPRTVDRHIDHIRLKTRAKNRSHMVSLAIASGLIPKH